jgi:hypothetical protein
VAFTSDGDFVMEEAAEVKNFLDAAGGGIGKEWKRCGCRF